MKRKHGEYEGSYEPYDQPQQLALLAIGASTGGVDALMSIFGEFSENCPPTVVVQHMRPHFLPGFVVRVNKHCPPKVKLATHHEVLESGTVYFAPGYQHLTVEDSGVELRCSLHEGLQYQGHIPSIDILFNSIAEINRQKIGVLLTGMGKDGATGLLKIRQSGGRTIGQDEASSIVYGMPRVAFELGATETQMPLDRISRELGLLGKKNA